jgi:hypothetical protein
VSLQREQNVLKLSPLRIIAPRGARSGRAARRERAARTERLKLSPLRIIAPRGARSGRAARGPSEELEWSCESHY